MKNESLIRQALEYASDCENALNGDTDAAERIGDADDSIEVLIDYI